MKRLIAALVLTGAVLAGVAFLGREPAGAPRPPLAPLAAEKQTRSLCTTHGPSSVQTGNVNIIRQDGMTAKGSEKGCATPQNEPTVAVSTRNPLHLLAGANDYRTVDLPVCREISKPAMHGWAYTSQLTAG